MKKINPQKQTPEATKSKRPKFKYWPKGTYRELVPDPFNLKHNREASYL